MVFALMLRDEISAAAAAVLCIVHTKEATVAYNQTGMEKAMPFSCTHALMPHFCVHRLDYGLLVDGQLHSLGDVQYLLSPQDLAAVELVPQLIRAGVVSFKIEGRLKVSVPYPGRCCLNLNY